MSQSAQITLYGLSYSPYVQRVQMALEEAKADYTLYPIDLANKPAWYTEKVNPNGKVPAMTYGGTKTSPENPSPDSAKLNESMVIVEFIAETFPETQLLPKDLIQRAHARMFIAAWDDKGMGAFRNLLMGAKPYTEVLDDLAELQGMLPEKGFVVGEWSIADIAFGPFLARLKLVLSNEIGKYPIGDGKKALAELDTPRFARLRKYIEDFEQRPSFKATWDEAKNLEGFTKNAYLKRD